MTSQKRPAKKDRPPFIRVSKLYYYAFWEKDKTKRLKPRRSAVFNDDDLTYVRSYDVLHKYYLRGDEHSAPLMSLAEHSIYLDLMLMLKEGEGWPLGEIAKALRIHLNTLTKYLDNLENINLIHREWSRDGKEHRIIIVLHTPLPKVELEKQRAELLRRRKDKCVQRRRLEAGRNKRDYLPTAFSWKKLLKAFDDKKTIAETFENIVADIYHQNKAKKDFSSGNFLEAVHDACRFHKVKFNWERHHKLALEIKEWLERL
jgi:DNA-binding MarR family transcriptional regulator